MDRWVGSRSVKRLAHMVNSGFDGHIHGKMCEGGFICGRILARNFGFSSGSVAWRFYVGVWRCIKMFTNKHCWCWMFMGIDPCLMLDVVGHLTRSPLVLIFISFNVNCERVHDLIILSKALSLSLPFFNLVSENRHGSFGLKTLAVTFFV
jgi:hypothetical protein